MGILDIRRLGRVFSVRQAVPQVAGLAKALLPVMALIDLSFDYCSQSPFSGGRFSGC